MRIKARYYLVLPQISLSHFEPSHSYDHPHCNSKDSLQYGFVTRMDFPDTKNHSSLGKVRFESVQDHSWHDVLRRPWLARVGPRRERGHRACQIRVSASSSSSHTIVSRAPLRYERGVNTFDTANLYSNGLSEVYLGNAIKALNLPREEIVVMTKV